MVRGGVHTLTPIQYSTAGKNLVVVGDAAVDLTLLLPDDVAPDEKVTVTRSVRSPGGTGANTAVAAARLGSNVALYSVVGDDLYGTWVLEKLRTLGVDVKHVVRVAGPTGLAVVLLGRATRTVVVDRGVSDELGVRYLDGPLSMARMAYLSGVPIECALWFVDNGLGQRTVLGLEARQFVESDPRWARLLGAVRLVLTNEAGAAALKAQHLWSPEGPGPSFRVVVTEASLGATIYEPGQARLHVDALEVEAVDATGAGDCFAGALCHYLDSGESVEASVQLAIVAAGLSTQGVGAQATLPRNEEVRAAVARMGGGATL